MFDSAFLENDIGSNNSNSNNNNNSNNTFGVKQFIINNIDDVNSSSINNNNKIDNNKQSMNGNGNNNSEMFEQVPDVDFRLDGIEELIDFNSLDNNNNKNEVNKNSQVIIHFSNGGAVNVDDFIDIDNNSSNSIAEGGQMIANNNLTNRSDSFASLMSEGGDMVIMPTQQQHIKASKADDDNGFDASCLHQMVSGAGVNNKAKRIRKRKTVQQMRMQKEAKLQELKDKKEKLTAAIVDGKQGIMELAPFIRLLLQKRGVDV